MIDSMGKTARTSTFKQKQAIKKQKTEGVSMKTRTGRMLACLFDGILTATAADDSAFAENTADPVSIVVVPNTIGLKK
ncbi:MAG: hypothetical protein IKI58_05535 [Oscillospiraceae bacterium]|nr:hypothetical protein [Oscillospiraceae bacterium]